MRTAIDTNVLSKLWSKEPGAASVAKRLGEAKTEGGLVVSAPVYAEFLVAVGLPPWRLVSCGLRYSAHQSMYSLLPRPSNSI